MTDSIYRYSFSADAPIEEVEASLVLALFAAESLHGETRVRLDARHALDLRKRSLVIDVATEVGHDLNRLFAGFLRREFGDESFQVEHLPVAVPAT